MAAILNTFLDYAVSVILGLGVIAASVLVLPWFYIAVVEGGEKKEK